MGGGHSLAKKGTPKSLRLNDQAEQILRSSTNVTASGEFRSSIYGKRRKSDLSLQFIVRDPLVEKAFKKYLETVLYESLLLFFVEVDNFHKQPPSDEKKERALHIYINYIKENAKYMIDIDTVTRADVTRLLQIKDGRSITQEDDFKIWTAFDIPFHKVFQVLKYEHMPQFLMSVHFQAIGTFTDAKEAKEKARSFAGDMDLSYILNSHMGMHYVRSFLFSPLAAEKLPQHNEYEAMFDLLQEIDDFKQSAQADHKHKRLQMILKRYAGEDVSGDAEHLKLLKAVKKEVEADPAKYRRPEDCLLDDVYHQLLDTLSEDFFEAFSKSPQWDDLVDSVSNVSTKIDRTEPLKRWMTDSGLLQGAQHAQLTSSMLSFHSLLRDNLGLFFFKKFCREHFQEESILFYIEIQHHKESPGDCNDEAHIERADHIIKKYIDTGAPMQINISASMRDEIKKKFEMKAMERIFDAAQSEVGILMQRNLWSRFQASGYFQAWQKKKAKDAQMAGLKQISKQNAEQRKTDLISGGKNIRKKSIFANKVPIGQLTLSQTR